MFDLDRFKKEYDKLEKSGDKPLSRYFRKFTAESFPAKHKSGEVNSRNVVLAGLFGMGYRIRAVESYLYPVFADARSVSKEINEVIESDKPRFSKIVKMMYLFDAAGERMKVGAHVAAVSLAGVDNINKFVDFKVDEFYRQEKNKAVVMLPTKDVAYEVIRNSVVCGYYFKLAQELV